MKKVFVFTSVHQWNDTRIFHKQVKSLSKNFIVEYHAPSDFEYKEIDKIKVIGLPYWKSYKDRIKIIFEIFKRIIKSNSDIYHFHDFELIPLGLFIRIFKKKPIIFDIHENYLDQIKYKLKIPKLLKYIIIFILKIFNRYLGSLFYLIFAENSYLKLYPKLDSKRFQTILNFPIIDVFNNFKLSNRKNNTDLFYIGAITPERGFYEMISALDILYKKNIELKLHLVGPNWYNLKIPKSFMHLENNVIFYGRMDIRDGYHYSKNALLGLSLLHPIKNYLESYPTKIFEYMACSLPVITSNFDLYKSIVEKNKCGYCVDPMNPLEIANAIEKFIINPVIAQEFGSNGNLLVQHKYNWVVEEDKLIKFYKKII